jgi:putative ABC transport system permease protein
MAKRILSLFRNLFRKRAVERELNDELRSSLEILTQEKMKQGVSQSAARREALIELGGVEQVKEEVRAVRAGRILEDFAGDVRFAFRTLAKSPSFTTVTVLTLALGIGANTAMFSVIYGVLLRPLPYPHPNRIVRLTWPGGNRDLTAEQFKFYRDHSTVFDCVGAYRQLTTVKLEIGKSVQWIRALSVTPGFFPALGVIPVIGRNFAPDEALPGGPEAVILTHALWKSAFGSDPNILGRQVELADQSFSVAGVLPAGFEFVEPADAFIPLRFTGSVMDQGSNASAIARLRPGATLSKAQAAMTIVFKEFAGIYGSRPGEVGVALIPYEHFMTRDYRPSLLMLLGAVGFLLLIACANVASLLLARSASRQKEISVRLALGASRFRLFRQFFAESVLLAVAGGAAGIVAAFWMLSGLVGSIPWELPATDRIELSMPVLVFALLISLASSLVFGLASSFQTAKVDLNSTLKEGWSRAGGGHTRKRKAIVAAQLALSLMMLIGAGLLIESLHNLYEQPTGLDARNLYAVVTPFEKSRASSVAGVWNFDQAVMQRMQAIPGVKSAAVVNAMPVAAEINFPVQRAGHPEDSNGAMQFRTASAGLFATMGVPVLRGRSFIDADTAASQPVIVVSESLARKWWGNQNPVGDQVIVGMYRGRTFAGLTEPPRTVVGVVGDVRAAGLDVPMQPTVYVPITQAPANLMAMAQPMRTPVFLVRLGKRAGIAAALHRAVSDVDSTQRVTMIEPMTEVIGGTVSRPRFNSLLLGVFAGIALFLTAIGLYGVVSYWVTQRTHEIGIRVALGAQGAQVLRMVVGQGLSLTLIGVTAGIAGAFGLTRFLASLLYGVKPADPLTFIVVSLIVIAVALLACYIPARRAAKVDPIVALRYE